MERESMEFDVLIVGAGVTGLAAAIRLKQLANEQQQDLEVCVVEKSANLGDHILSGAVIEPRALDELLPNWKELGAPLKVPATKDQVYLLHNATKATKLPSFVVPATMHNKGNYIVSLANLTRWLGEQAEALEVNIFPGFPAASIIYGTQGQVEGIVTGDMGRDASGQPKDNFEPGMELKAKYTLFAEGVHGHLGKELIAQFDLAAGKDAQHYALGLKELWKIDPAKHQPGLVVHGSGWPLTKDAGGGFFLYHDADNQVAVGLTVDLSYSNPYLSPFDEFQRLKHHPVLKQYLEGGERIAYGARAITKGGFNCLPKMTFPGGLLIGCNAGTLNFAKIKGVHTGMKSGMLAAESVFDAIQAGDAGGQELTSFTQKWEASWAYAELKKSRNFGPAMHKYGTFFGGAFNFIDQNIFRGKLPLTLHDTKPDYATFKLASESKAIEYPKPDNKISFDKLSSVYLSGVTHEEDQPVHLRLTDPDIPLRDNLPKYAEPAVRYCPAGVYEIVEDEPGQPKFQINFSNCIHCKTCDLKDPAQNITWVTPEGQGGPMYPNM